MGKGTLVMRKKTVFHCTLNAGRIHVLVLRRGIFLPERADRGDVCLEPLFVGAVSLGRELDQSVQGNLHPGRALLRDVHEVGVNAT